MLICSTPRTSSGWLNRTTPSSAQLEAWGRASGIDELESCFITVFSEIVEPVLGILAEFF